MRASLTAALLLALCPLLPKAAAGEEIIRVERGSLRKTQIPIGGTLETHQVVPAYAPIEGRVQLQGAMTCSNNTP